jgi:hypothetical protein
VATSLNPLTPFYTSQPVPAPAARRPPFRVDLRDEVID